jgi:nitroimidazol reductase NimA-like FMN-containing flavoprotein (pyridoxamine 5'-phosphate oxidase superfamily)
MKSITRRRPAIPQDYGIAEDDTGMLEWEDVAVLLARAPVYWVSTVRGDGEPHLTPIWGAFTADTAYFEGGRTTQWARNLLGGNGRCHLGVDHEGTQVMVRGPAEMVTVDAPTQTAIADVYEAKYPYRPTGSEFWKVAPDAVLAWSTTDLDAFASTPTQFDFGVTR